jgi:aspartate aminotransferase-like enzyme
MGIDICLIGSQKVLGLLPDLSILGITDKAWSAIEKVNYKGIILFHDLFLYHYCYHYCLLIGLGYDALRPWRHAPRQQPFPYTHNARAINALAIALRLFEAEGFDSVCERHEAVAQYCRQRVQAMGLSLFPTESQRRSPTGMQMM